jgi:hypothetical protein
MPGSTSFCIPQEQQSATIKELGASAEGLPESTATGAWQALGLARKRYQRRAPAYSAAIEFDPCC